MTIALSAGTAPGTVCIVPQPLARAEGGLLCLSKPNLVLDFAFVGVESANLSYGRSVIHDGVGVFLSPTFDAVGQ
jgi:hypothetical protein